MKITVAIDSLKGSLTSIEAGNAVCEGIKKVYPQAEVAVFPVADGGEGTVEALITGLHAQRRQIEVQDPLGRTITAVYGILKEQKMAVMEMASAAGITLLKPEERNPLETSTFGVGQMICDAVRQGCRTFLIGIGGLGTNDGGAWMLQALGFDLLDENGKKIEPGALGLSHLHQISTDHVLPELAECTFHIACDVVTPLCGSRGCSAVYGPQKGADEKMIRQMDQWLFHYAEVTKKIYGHADKDYPGAGAAGGLGFAFLAYTKAVLESGISLILKIIGLEEEIKDSDFVITGEGKLDGQTVMGKAPVGIAGMAKRYHKPVIAFSGAAAEDAALCNGAGIDAFFPIVRSAVSLEKAMARENAVRNMTDTSEQVFRLIKVLT